MAQQQINTNDGTPYGSSTAHHMAPQQHINPHDGTTYGSSTAHQPKRWHNIWLLNSISTQMMAQHMAPQQHINPNDGTT
jgi:hypothetical protein